MSFVSGLATSEEDEGLIEEKNRKAKAIAAETAMQVVAIRAVKIRAVEVGFDLKEIKPAVELGGSSSSFAGIRVAPLFDDDNNEAESEPIIHTIKSPKPQRIFKSEILVIWALPP